MEDSDSKQIRETRVLVLYTGGTIGMKKTDGGKNVNSALVFVSACRPVSCIMELNCLSFNSQDSGKFTSKRLLRNL